MQIRKIKIDNMVAYEQEWLKIFTFNPTDYEKKNGLYASRVGANIALPHYHIGPRVTPFYYLLCVLEGEGEFIQQGKKYKLQENDIFCLFPQVIHEYYCNPERPIKKFILAFSGKQALATLSQIGLTAEQPYRHNGVNQDTINAFLHMFAHHKNPIARLNGLYSIFDSLVVYDTPTINARQTSDDWLLKGKHYIEHSFSEAITVEEIANKVGIERTHFTKMFSQRFQISPMQYIIQLRMNEAVLLLKHTDYQIVEIAQAVGYQDISAFSKAFKRELGVSPVSYRQQHVSAK